MSYPILLNLENKDIVIVGGGKIAYRKCNNFLEFGYSVTVIAPELIKEFDNIKENISIINDIYKEEYIKDSYLVVGATNDRSINEAIGIYCRKNKIIANIVDNKELSSFIVPSTVKRGDLNISISTNGKSPSLCSKIKKEIEEVYTDEYEEYINLLGEIRIKVLKKVNNESEKKKILNSLVHKNLEELRDFKI